MTVTYRLAGVDGEATEEVVDSIADSGSASDQDPEVKFGIARDIAEVGFAFAFSFDYFSVACWKAQGLGVGGQMGPFRRAPGTLFHRLLGVLHRGAIGSDGGGGGGERRAEGRGGGALIGIVGTTAFEDRPSFGIVVTVIADCLDASKARSYRVAVSPMWGSPVSLLACGSTHQASGRLPVDRKGPLCAPGVGTKDRARVRTLCPAMECRSHHLSADDPYTASLCCLPPPTSR